MCWHTPSVISVRWLLAQADSAQFLYNADSAQFLYNADSAQFLYNADSAQFLYNVLYNHKTFESMSFMEVILW